MEEQNSIQVFEDKKVRSIWDADLEKWFFYITDVIEVLSDSDRPRKYWNDLKTKLKKEGSELSEKIGQLKMKALDGNLGLRYWNLGTIALEIMMNKEILKEIKARILAKDAEAKLFLFGSRATGKASADSDWDILILLNGPQLLAEEEQRFLYPIFDLEFETGVIIHPFIYSRHDWQTRYPGSPLYQQVMKTARPI